MTEEDQEHLFEPFYSGFENGRGLGMSIVRKIVEDYDGRIDVRSELNKGPSVRDHTADPTRPEAP